MDFKKINPFEKVKENLDKKTKEEIVQIVTTHGCYEWKTIKDGEEKVVLLSPDDLALITTIALEEGQKLIREYNEDLGWKTTEETMRKLIKYVTTKEALIGK